MFAFFMININITNTYMSKYDKFEEFMDAVINEADSLSRKQYGRSLTETYQVGETILSITKALMSNGWYVFIAVVALLLLGKLAFIMALGTFLLSPVGIVVLGALIAFGGKSALKLLYTARRFPIAVKEVGEAFKADFEQHVNDNFYIDAKISQAAQVLIDKAS